MSDFLSFRTMITPGIMKILCYIGMVVAFIAGIVMVMTEPITGIGLMILGPLVVRMYAELMLVIFEIHAELKRINGGG
ncbi:MAG: DUF4282 domain-containing protein [Verrucomicrobia bacterium]|nr:DUF4282 domain-containing protein [Verrucomicrobiota bacterium]